MNDKSIVVINTPKNCRVCPFRQSPWNFCLGEYEKEKRCPLRPLPERKEMPKNCANFDYTQGIVDGWNRCWDEVTGVIWD